MPFMHSESLAIHEEALRLFDQPGLEKRLKYEKMHMDILQQFGLYPHRNAILGRPLTKEEEEYLERTCRILKEKKKGYWAKLCWVLLLAGMCLLVFRSLAGNAEKNGLFS